jgi:hypothetical protein
MRHYYIATNADLDVHEYTSGFANTWGAVACRSKAERDRVLADTRALKARECTRSEAIKLTQTGRDGRKVVSVYGTDKYVVLWESDYAC